MVQLSKFKFLNRRIYLFCLMCMILMLVNISVYGESKTYYLDGKDTIDIDSRYHYFFFIPTSSASGRYDLTVVPYSGYLNSVDSLVIKPYKIWAKYVYHSDYFGYTDEGSLAISSCSANGTIDSSSTIKKVGKGETFTGYIAVNKNEGLIFDYYTGYTGFNNRDYMMNGSVAGYVQISVQLDEAAPCIPAIPTIKSGSGNIVELDNKVYTNNDAVTLTWEQVADNKTNFEGYEVGSDWASEYMINH
jgi:hypothetical protein